VEQLREVSNKAHNAELKLFLEVALGLVMICLICASFLFCMLLILVFAMALFVYPFRICGRSLLLRRARKIFFFSSNSTTQKRKNFGTFCFN